MDLYSVEFQLLDKVTIFEEGNIRFPCIFENVLIANPLVCQAMFLTHRSKFTRNNSEYLLQEEPF